MEFDAFAGGAGTLDLQPCSFCGRNFNEESLAKHENICKKIQLKAKKRKIFDSSKQRSQGTGTLGRKSVKPHEKQPEGVKITNWRQNHLDFVNAIRSARAAQKAIDTGQPLPPPPPPSINPDYIQCPYCSRRFNQKAAERHIPFCQQRTRTHGEPIKALTKRAAADVGNSTTGRRKMYYSQVVRGRQPNVPAYGSETSPGFQPYSSAFGGNGPNSVNETPQRPLYSARAKRQQGTSVGRTQRRISSASSPYTGSSLVQGDRLPNGSYTRPGRVVRAPSGGTRTPQQKNHKGSVRFSDQVETFPITSSDSPGTGSISSSSFSPQPPAHHSTPRTTQNGHVTTARRQRQDQMTMKGGSHHDTLADNSDSFEITTPLDFGQSSINSSGYNSSSPVASPSSFSPSSPRHQLALSPLTSSTNSPSPRENGHGPQSPRNQVSLPTSPKDSSPGGSRQSYLIKKEGSVYAPFCYDCGTQYPTSTAQFCCSCGIQRAYISSR